MEQRRHQKTMTHSPSDPTYVWKDDKDQTFRVYCLAKEVWPKRRELTSKGITWGEWFRNHSGMSLHEFSDWANDHKLREKWNQSVKKSG
mgnify:FL=1